MTFRRAVLLCTAGAIAIGLGVASQARRADAASRAAVAQVEIFVAPVPASDWGMDMSGANTLPAGQAILVRIPHG